MVQGKVRSRCISQENRVGQEQILYQANQNFRTKKISYLIFSNCSKETFRFLEYKFRGQFNLQRRVMTACSQIRNWTECETETQRAINKKYFHKLMFQKQYD